MTAKCAWRGGFPGANTPIRTSLFALQNTRGALVHAARHGGVEIALELRAGVLFQQGQTLRLE